MYELHDPHDNFDSMHGQEHLASEMDPSHERKEGSSFRRAKEVIGRQWERWLTSRDTVSLIHARKLTREMQRDISAHELEVDVALAETSTFDEEVSIELSSDSDRISDVPKEQSHHTRAKSKYSIVLAGALLAACSSRGESQEEPKEAKEAAHVVVTPGQKIKVRGSSDGLQSFIVRPDLPQAPELTSLEPPDCGPANPPAAPLGCGIHQWEGYSETNPAAVAWMAVANTGTKGCTVKINRLELSYEAKGGVQVILSSEINGVQLLADGTVEGSHWGKYLDSVRTGSEFYIPKDAHGYVHPFGPMIKVPSDAVELRVTFAVEMTPGCVAGAGIDTYEEYGMPRSGPGTGYTQDGSESDFIKEALKSPWVSQTVDVSAPASYAFRYVPVEDRQQPDPDVRKY